jgi:putative aldouronate transport system permease protein
MRKELFRTIFVSSGIWQGVGWGSIIYLSTLSGIDPNLYEAAAIDGAGRFKQLLHITLPALIPTITVLLIMRLGHIMSQGFEKIILLYNPLTYETADVISSYVYRRGLQESDYSFGAAVGLFNSIINVTVLIMSNYLSRRITKESLW